MQESIRLAAADPPLRILEIGPGRGEFLFHLAKLYPHAELTAVEMKKRRFLNLVKRAQAQNQNERTGGLTLFCGDARDILPTSIPPQSQDEIHIQFPDPWPKRRHGKHRLMNPDSLAAFAAALKPGGSLYFATDVEWYAQDVAKLFKKSPHFIAHGDEAIQTTPTPLFASYFAEKWRKLGRAFYYQAYKRTDCVFA